MPGATVRIGLSVSRLRQRQMDRPPLLRGTDRYTAERTVDDGTSRAHRSPAAHRFRLDRRERDPEPLGRTQQQQRIADRFGRREQQKTPRSARAPRAAGRSSSRSAPTATVRPATRSRRPAAVAVNPLGSSSRASGLPRVSAMIRSRTCSSSLNRTAEPSRARASPLRTPCTSNSGRRWSSCPGSRAENTIPTGSASRRRDANASVSAEVRSSHCASSTTHSRGRCSASFGRRLVQPARRETGPGLRPS